MRRISRSTIRPGGFEGGEAGYRLDGVLDEADGDTQNPLFHLITLDPLPRDLPVRSLPRLILAAHVREINEGEVVFYRHDAQGMPRRIGGEPSWIQGASVPTCPICGEKMEFLIQLDSELPSCEQSGEVMFGSGGILYVFWCERTRVSGFFMQCT